MSRRADGGFECDKCGEDVGNGGVLAALVVSDLDPDNPGMVRSLHFCRDREDKTGTVIKGCDGKVLNANHLKHYKEKQA